MFAGRTPRFDLTRILSELSRSFIAGDGVEGSAVRPHHQNRSNLSVGTFAALAAGAIVTQSNLAAMKSSEDPVIRRLLGTHKGWGQFLSLDDAWAANMIDAVGNYGEVFERDLGSGSVMRIARGPNNLWTKGGLMVAAPMR